MTLSWQWFQGGKHKNWYYKKDKTRGGFTIKQSWLLLRMPVQCYTLTNAHIHMAL